MKTIKFFKSISFLLVLVGVFSVLAFRAEAGCTNCGEGEQECYRVVQGGTIHIFYGKASPCQ